MKTNATRQGSDGTNGRTASQTPRTTAGDRAGLNRDRSGGRPSAAFNHTHSPGGTPGTTLALNLTPQCPAAGQHGPDLAQHPHRMKNTTLIVALLLGLSASTTYAEDAGTAPENPRPRHCQGPPGGGPRHQAGLAGQADAQEVGRPEGAPRPGSPLVRALDANGDGVIDAAEISNASQVLLTLDANGDGQLTLEEVRPAGARGPGGPGHGLRDGTGPRHAPPQDAPAE